MKHYITPIILLFTLAVSAQDTDSVPKIKLSSYIQMQYQFADSAGIASYAGGDFGFNIDNRFQIRRARIKAAYQYKNAELVTQLDFGAQNVAIVDAYIRLSFPKIDFLKIQAGLADRVWGFETSYPSRLRESPERSRVYQTLLPSERDIGISLFIQPKTTNFLKNTELKFALVNGTARAAQDFDSFKDFIGTLQFNFPELIDGFDLAFGTSHYRGSIRQESFVTFREGIVSNGNKGFRGDTSSNNVGKRIKRIYTGFNTQMKLKTAIGESKIMAEYIVGAQPGTIPTSVINGPAASRSFTSQPFTDIYIRNFRGFYVAYAQSFKNCPLRTILKYDEYDPNTFIKGNELKSDNTNLTGADVKYKTIGFGLLYNPNEQIQFTAYYDWVINEKTQLQRFRNDISDNVFTLRLQYTLK